MNKQIMRSTVAILAFIAGINIATPARANSKHSYYPSSEESDNVFLPELVIDSVLQQTSELSGLAMDELEIVDYQQHTWTSGCRVLGFGPCTMALVPGWIVTVESETQKWTYHTTKYGGGGLASHYQWEYNAEHKKWSNRTTSYAFASLLNFFDFPETQEYDQAKIKGFRYTMTSNSRFDRIILPTSTTGENLFTILTENSTTQVTSKIGSVGQGSILNSTGKDQGLRLKSTDKGLRLNSTSNEGVKEFTITDINPSINLLEYPLLITSDPYSPSTFTYEVELLEKPEVSQPKSVPELSTTFSLFTLGIWGLLKRKKTDKN